MASVFDSILSCARDNDAAGIKQLVSMGCPPSFPNKMGQTALHIGGIWGSVDAVKALLEARADPNAQNKLRGSAPLHACAMGRGPADKRAECVKLMIAAKGNPRLQDLTGETPIEAAADEEIRLALGAMPLHLHKAARARSAEALASCIATIKAETSELTLETTDQTGDTALHVAASTSWREGVELLLKAGSVVDCINNMQQTPLHFAAMTGNHRVVQILLQKSASADTKDSDPDHDPRFKSTSFEANPDEHRTPLHYASQLGNIVSMRVLLEEGKADPNERDSALATPLHCCLQLREAETELEPGCGVKLQGIQAKPAWNGRFGSVLGPMVSKDGGEKRWPVLIDGEAGDGVLLKEASLQRVCDEAIDLLLKARADVNLGTRAQGETRTVLHEAARAGDLALASLCLSAGADVNRQDAKLGLTALHMAARGKHHQLAKLLVSAKADVDEKSAGGKTACELARVNGCPEEILAIYRGKEVPTEVPAVEKKQTLDSLTPEQRAMLFID